MMKAAQIDESVSSEPVTIYVISESVSRCFSLFLVVSVNRLML